ncbi:MAG: aspartate/glutamate racemase family protein [Xanthobacteraceae bacterium]
MSVTLNAVLPMMAGFAAARGESWGVTNYLDEGLQANVRSDGGVTARSLHRMEGLLERAVEGQVDAVLLTCTVFSPHIASFRARFPLPIIGADVAMLDKAAGLHRRTAILCTFSASLATSLEMLRRAAERIGAPCEAEAFLVDGALEAMAAGDRARHDDLVVASAKAHAQNFDALVLAQMSMAGAADQLTACGVPVLTSPNCAIDAVRKAIDRRRAALAGLLQPED